MPNRILVAYPHPAGLDDLCRGIVGHGYRVERASSGLECVRRLTAEHYDLLVIHDELTWGSGLGVIGVLHEDPDLRAIPVILVCPRPPANAPPANVVASLTCPVAADRLLDAVRRVLPTFL